MLNTISLYCILYPSWFCCGGNNNNNNNKMLLKPYSLNTHTTDSYTGEDLRVESKLSLQSSKQIINI